MLAMFVAATETNHDKKKCVDKITANNNKQQQSIHTNKFETAVQVA